MTNPYDADTPLWQLHENMVSAEHVARAYASDAERYTKRSLEMRDKADLYRQAIAVLNNSDPTLTPKQGSI
jgi:hypothetical protein